VGDSGFEDWKRGKKLEGARTRLAFKNEPATLIETVAGGTTYVQMVILTGNWRGGGRLLQVDAGDAQKVIAKLKPLHE